MALGSGFSSVFLNFKVIISLHFLKKIKQKLWFINQYVDYLFGGQTAHSLVVRKKIISNKWKEAFMFYGLKASDMGFLGGPAVRNPPARLAWWYSWWESTWQIRGHRFGPWSRKIPRAMEQLSPRATPLSPGSTAQALQLLKPSSLRACAQKQKPPQWKARTLQQRVAPTCSN